ncbi:MAG: hypothetical protein RMJ19_00750 [Gemmatales bacterium]|nr:hypothetical protein [Gemmatales bacterium]MDW8174173.1 hypothetical protein [Gemmatales bacterium]
MLDWKTGKLVPRAGPMAIWEFSRTGKYAITLENDALEIYDWRTWRLVK